MRPLRHRREVGVRGDDLVGARRRAGQPARQLLDVEPLGAERERPRRVVAGLEFERAEVDRPPVEPRRGAGLVATQPEAEAPHRFGDTARRPFAEATATLFPCAREQHATEERPRRQNDARRVNDLAVGEFDAAGTRQDRDCLAGHDLEVRLGRDPPGHLAVVERPITLRAWRPNRRALPCVQRAELDPGRVGAQPHLAAERVDLANELPLRDATDRRIARHAADRGRIEHDAGRTRADPRRGQRGLGAGVTTTDHDHVEVAGLAHPIGRYMWTYVMRHREALRRAVDRGRGSRRPDLVLEDSERRSAS